MLLRRTENDIPVLRIHYSADPELTPEKLAPIKKRFSKVWWDLEMEINYEAKSGQRVYPDFNAAIHVLPDSKIPKSGCLYMSIDPHPRTPHASLWVLIDQWSDWYVIRELWPSVWKGNPAHPTDEVSDNVFTVKDYCEAIAVLEGNDLVFQKEHTDREYAKYVHRSGGEKIITRFMDQAGKGFRASGEADQEESFSDRFARYGIRCIDPIKSHDAGEDAVQQLLKPRHHNLHGSWPKLHIAESCKELILELSKYRYKATPAWNREVELKQKGVAARCHLIDNLRYLATGRIGYIPSQVSEVNR